ncbi:hypothetical protein TPE_2177 [Treponema pedis str. T A4]|uniref:Uncharacterized protein n=1 Tax=Treponema pedis str. T A4 TaxID=1291379 RepID=S6A4Q2_9SPIR|nr:hypothetical protein TPE_2177 [Treponema pedis str. T A4]
MQKYIFIPNVQKFAAAVAFAYSPAESIIRKVYFFAVGSFYAFQAAVGVPFVTVTYPLHNLLNNISSFIHHLIISII